MFFLTELSLATSAFSEEYEELRVAKALTEVALWALVHSNSYEEAVLKAINLGEDTNTVRAVCRYYIWS